MVTGNALFVVVSGPPASGKSTIAPAIAAHLGLPLIAKDTIKDALMSVLPVPDLATSRQLGKAAVAAMLAVAAQAPGGAVIESNFYRSVAVESLSRLPGTVIEVFCRCDRRVAAARYLVRAGTRHAGNFDSLRSEQELWNDEVANPIAGGWPVVEVDTNRTVDITSVLRELQQHAGGRPGSRRASRDDGRALDSDLGPATRMSALAIGAGAIQTCHAPACPDG